ncbi:histidine phosphatase family protein [Flavobacteriaceae bacterium]|nr:histidine phosphatase family protein [Flavobacteriaceae bacterium]MDA9584504.1 histidine phosphatase family protein [Flavobacteriaceae bacterium]MDC0331780.1 histidine phosphatase family protein [Flavobacteriaceae bacterium]
MKKNILVICFSLISFISYSQEVTTYYFVRHAEKLRVNKTDRNPNLSSKGFKRAEAWKEVFSNISFDAIYSTDYTRTMLTAKPTADSKNLPILIYNPRDMYSKTFQNQTKGKTILVVGHSNTTNVFANKVLGFDKYEEIKDNNNSNLYIVTVMNGNSSSILLQIN